MFSPSTLAGLRRMAAQHMAAHPKPDFIVGSAANPYLHRWWLTPRDEQAGVYLHQFWRSDDDRALHDHPYESTSIILEGQYIEHLAHGVAELRQRGWVGSRSATEAHRIELLNDAKGRPLPVTTLFLHGPRVREWGFYCPRGWVPWQEFLGGDIASDRGVGCG